MTTLLGDPIFNIEEKEYWEDYQHTLKSLYELRANNGDEKGGTSPSDNEDGSEDKSDSSSESSSNNSGHDDDDSSTNRDDNSRSYDSPYSGDDWGEPPNDREDEGADLFYEEYNSDVDYYDQDMEEVAEANRWSDTDSDQYRLTNVLENAREENAQGNQMYHDEYPYSHLSDWSDINNVNSRSGPRYDKHRREVPELGSYYDLEPSLPILHTEEEDDIDARLAALDQKLMVYSFKIMTLENAQRNEERMEESKSEHLP
ncbi:hypothetical protein SO802_029283 [Lithocarpus litseifolius]|uniref:Uncharacterized protein n=1 Tax=Lithocarpus litseifolius TaxID=425828 RepID=A0AAW2BW85_9ROSI